MQNTIYAETTPLVQNAIYAGVSEAIKSWGGGKWAGAKLGGGASGGGQIGAKSWIRIQEVGSGLYPLQDVINVMLFFHQV